MVLISFALLVVACSAPATTEEQVGADSSAVSTTAVDSSACCDSTKVDTVAVADTLAK